MKTFVISTCIALIMLPFIYAWNEHATWVQNVVVADMTDYQEPEWLQTESILDWNRHALNIHTVMGGSWDTQERYDYRESIYEIMYALSNTPEELGGKIEAANVAYDEWKNSVSYFIDNRLYAMYHTF